MPNLRAQLEPIAVQIATNAGINPTVFTRLITQESGWNPEAKSSAGAIGLAQFMPGTAKAYGIDPTDPIQSMQGAAQYLSNSLKMFNGDYPKAVASYNAGPGAVQKYGGVPPFKETQNYVKNILGGMNPGQSSPVPNIPIPNYQAPPVQITNPLMDFSKPVPLNNILNIKTPSVDPSVVASSQALSQPFPVVKPSQPNLITQNEANQQAGQYLQQLQTQFPVQTPHNDILGGIQGLAGNAENALGNLWNGTLKGIETTGQTYSHPWTSPQDALSRNPVTHLLGGAIGEGANLINGISAIPSDINNALPWTQKTVPTFQIPTGGIQQYNAQDPVFSTLGGFAPYIAGDLGVKAVTEGIPALAHAAEFMESTPLNRLLNHIGTNAAIGAIGSQGAGRLPGAIGGAALGGLIGGGIEGVGALKRYLGAVADNKDYQAWLQQHEALNNLEPTSNPIQVGAATPTPDQPIVINTGGSNSSRFNVMNPEAVNHPEGVPRFYNTHKAAADVYNQILANDPTFTGQIKQIPDGRYVINQNQMSSGNTIPVTLPSNPEILPSNPEILPSNPEIPPSNPEIPPSKEQSPQEPVTDGSTPLLSSEAGSQEIPQTAGPKLASNGYYDPATLTIPDMVKDTFFQNKMAANRAIRTITKNSPELEGQLETLPVGKNQWAIHEIQANTTDSGGLVTSGDSPLSQTTGSISPVIIPGVSGQDLSKSLILPGLKPTESPVIHTDYSPNPTPFTFDENGFMRGSDGNTVLGWVKKTDGKIVAQPKYGEFRDDLPIMAERGQTNTINKVGEIEKGYGVNHSPEGENPKVTASKARRLKAAGFDSEQGLIDYVSKNYKEVYEQPPGIGKTEPRYLLVDPDRNVALEVTEFRRHPQGDYYGVTTSFVADDLKYPERKGTLIWSRERSPAPPIEPSVPPTSTPRLGSDNDVSVGTGGQTKVPDLTVAHQESNLNPQTNEAVQKAFEEGKIIHTPEGNEVFAGKTPDKTQAALNEAALSSARQKGPQIVSRAEGRQIVQENYPDKLPHYDAFWQAGSEGKQLNLDYTERVRGFSKGTVDDHMTRLANGDTPGVENFKSLEQAKVAAEAFKRLNPTAEVSDPYKVTETYTTPKTKQVKTKEVWHVDAAGTRQIDPFAIGVLHGKDGEPHVYQMSYNYNSTKAGNVRSYRIDRFNDTVEGFDASKIDENSPYHNTIQAKQQVANEARQTILDSMPNRAKAAMILDHYDNGRVKVADGMLKSELRNIKDDDTFEKVEQAFKAWCLR